MTTSFAAVNPGTDLAQHARALRRVRDAVLSGGKPPERPRTLVARSWQRVLDLGLDPDGRNPRQFPSLAQVEQRRSESGLNDVIDDLRSVLTRAADAASYLMVVTDSDGVVLWRDGSARVRHTADRLGFVEGATWTESVVGTNSIGTALAERAPVELFSAEHFESNQHPWYCTASPIHDPRTGDLLGVVDVSGPALTLHPALCSLVESAARIAELSLWRRHQQQLELLRRECEPVIGAMPGPLLVVDDDGWVALRSGVAGRDRIEAPQHNRPVAVPELGLCLPERLGHGWLVRPTCETQSLAAVLIPGSPAVLEVTSGDQPWRTTVSPRHAEILRLLAMAGPAGLSAEALSRAVFADADHQVTVRAEVSRLRRTVGALVATNPFRLADGVNLTVAG